MSSSNPHILQELKSKVVQLPSMPLVVTKVLQLINNPKTSAEDISRYIENDISMSSMILKLANSAYYGIPQTISSIQTAIVILGFNSIKTLIIPASMAQIFPVEKDDQALFHWDKFWVHAVETAVFSRALAKQFPTLDRDQMFSAGLLHNVGRLILKQLYPQEFLLISQDVAQGLAWSDAEIKHIGISAVDAGVTLFENWNFPDVIRETIRNYEDPKSNQRGTQGSWVIHLSHRLSQINGTLTVMGEPFLGEDGEAIAQLGLRGTERDWLEQLRPELAKASAFLELFK